MGVNAKIVSATLIISLCCFANSAGDCDFKQSQRDLWNNTVTPLLTSELWETSFMYDATHALMVPLHHAFSSGDKKRQDEFSHFVQKFLEKGTKETESNVENRVQFSYLLSQYLKLKTAKNFTPSDRRLFDYLIKEQLILWQSHKVPWYDRMSFNGLESRLEWRLKTPNPRLAWFRLMPDEEWFALSVASDLFALHQDAPFDRYYRSNLAPLLRDTLKEYLVFQADGNWLMKPGVWAGHRDYLYAGYAEKGVNLPPKPLPDTTQNTSHLHRFPLWIQSWGAMTEVYPSERNFMNRVSTSLERQFFNAMLVPPSSAVPFYRMNNYMDGRNGLYRWEYNTVGENRGYGPYELSGTLALGWWTFLPGTRIDRVFESIAKSYPLSKEAVDLYVGPNTSRERHPIMAWPQAFNNGLLELIAKLAADPCMN